MDLILFGDLNARLREWSDHESNVNGQLLKDISNFYTVIHAMQLHLKPFRAKKQYNLVI